jgi:broad specificity phosphatase PhoE/adenylylsulfate kinase-like enzyme
MNLLSLSASPKNIVRRTSSIFAKDEDYNSDEKLVIFMSGLPARGKSYISKKLQRYLTWLGYHTQVFNVGNYRRKKLGGNQDSNFFDPNDPQNQKIREDLAINVLESLLDWLMNEKGQIAIHDATNSTRERREKLLTHMKNYRNIRVLFIESDLTDPKILEANIRMKLKSPDYRDMPPEEARKDFLERLKNYERAYEALDDTKDADLPYIQLINVGKRVITNNINGYLSGEIVFYLMNYHIQPRTIWLTRHGETEDNVKGVLGGDAPLNQNGFLFAEALRDFILSQNLDDLQLWHSSLQRTHQTAQPLKPFVKHLKAMRMLNEIYAGLCEGMSYEEVKAQIPNEFDARQKDKLRYRYPNGGESYLDVINREKPVIIELERVQTPVLIISHRAVIRTLYSYFREVPIDQLPLLNIPLNTIVKLTPTPYGCEEQRFFIDLEKYKTNKSEPFWQEIAAVDQFFDPIQFPFHL